MSGLAAFSPDDAIWVLGQVAFAIVGAVVASRRPELPFGWLFSVAGLLGLVEGIAARAAVHALVDSSESAWGGAAAWLSAALWYPNGALLVLGALLFPSGRPPSRGWWAVAWALGAGAALAAVGMVLLWPTRGLDLLDPSPGSSRAPLGTALTNVALLIQAGCAAATVVALLVRLRRARGVERQQLKWLIYAAAVAVSGLLLLIPRELGFGSSPGLNDLVGAALSALGVLGIPVAIGVAILRYRLFDIDLLISRTWSTGCSLRLSPRCTSPSSSGSARSSAPAGSGSVSVDRRHRCDCRSVPACSRTQSTTCQPARLRRTSQPLRGALRIHPSMAGAATDDSLQQMARLVVEATGAAQATVWLRLGDQLQPQARWPPTGPPPSPSRSTAMAQKTRW